MALAACCLRLGACSLKPEAWSFNSLAVDHDPRAKLLPGIAHDFELQRNGCQLRRRCMANFYCEFFHLIPISFFIIRRISSRISAILFNCVRFKALAA